MLHSIENKMPMWHVPVHGYTPTDSELARRKMSLWHVPYQGYSSMDPFMESMMDKTFPPFRYFPLLNDKLNTKNGKTDQKLQCACSPNSKTSCWVCGPKTACVCSPKDKSSCVCDPKEKNDEGFVVNLDVKHYKPDEVTLKVEGRVLEVSGKHRKENDNGFECSEFHRKYTISDDIDPSALTSNISQDGVLHIEAPKMLPVTDSIESDTFKCSLDVQGFKPEQISIQVKGRELVVHGEIRKKYKSKHGLNTHLKQFTRNISLPDDVDPSHLSSRFTKDSMLTIEAPRKLSQSPIKLEIKTME